MLFSRVNCSDKRQFVFLSAKYISGLIIICKVVLLQLVFRELFIKFGGQNQVNGKNTSAEFSERQYGFEGRQMMTLCRE